METSADGVLGAFHGDEAFPVDWKEGERDLFWILDDLHCPNPISPMFFDIGGWWLTCDHMFRRFGTPFASDWVAKRVNGYLYTAAVPADPSAYGEASEYGGRYVPETLMQPLAELEAAWRAAREISSLVFLWCVATMKSTFFFV